MKKRRNAARRFVQNGVKKYIFNRQKEGENYFLKRRRNHWPIDFLDLKKDVKLSKIHNKYRNTEIQKNLDCSQQVYLIKDVCLSLQSNNPLRIIFSSR